MEENITLEGSAASLYFIFLELVSSTHRSFSWWKRNVTDFFYHKLQSREVHSNKLSTDTFSTQGLSHCTSIWTFWGVLPPLLLSGPSSCFLLPNTLVACYPFGLYNLVQFQYAALCFPACTNSPLWPVHYLG